MRWRHRLLTLSKSKPSASRTCACCATAPPGFEDLDLPTKKLLYYFYEAALSGRDIIYDQRYAYNLAIRRTLEKILRDYPGERDTDDFKALVLYTKRVLFSNGIHHHYANDKFEPGFSFDAFARYVHETPGEFPTRPGQSLDDFLTELRPVIFDPAVDAKLVDKRGGIDVVTASAVNFYAGVTQADVEAFYAPRIRAVADYSPTKDVEDLVWRQRNGGTRATVGSNVTALELRRAAQPAARAPWARIAGFLPCCAASGKAGASWSLAMERPWPGSYRPTSTAEYRRVPAPRS